MLRGTEEIVNEYDTGSVPALIYPFYIQCCGSRFWIRIILGSRIHIKIRRRIRIHIKVNVQEPVLRICDILVRVQIRGSVPLTTDPTPNTYLGLMDPDPGCPKNIRIRNTRSYDGSKWRHGGGGLARGCSQSLCQWSQICENWWVGSGSASIWKVGSGPHQI